MKMFVNVIKSYRDVVAVCDEDILRKKFEEGSFQLHIKENFYKGVEMEKDKLLEFLKKVFVEDSTFNIVGKNSVEVALESGIASEGDVGEIQGVPFIIVLI